MVGMGIALGFGEAVGMGIVVGLGEAVGGMVAVDVGVAICAPVQPENARQNEIKTIKIRSKFFLIIASRGSVNECSSWKFMATHYKLQSHVGRQ